MNLSAPVKKQQTGVLLHTGNISKTEKKDLRPEMKPLLTISTSASRLKPSLYVGGVCNA